MSAVVVMVATLVLLLLVLRLIVTVADLRAVGARALATVGVDDGVRWRGAVLGVVHLPAQSVHAHALLGGHLVGAHLQGDGGGVHGLPDHLIVKDVSSGAWGRHAGLERGAADRIKNTEGGSANTPIHLAMNGLTGSNPAGVISQPSPLGEEQDDIEPS